jgi:peptidoglycan hydrolase CwlO-like protein
MTLKRIEHFHWLTKTVILLTALVFVLIGIAFVASMVGYESVATNMLLLTVRVLNILVYLFFGVLLIVGIAIAIRWLGTVWVREVRPQLAITGVVTPGDTRGIKEWVERQGSVSEDARSELSDVRTEIRLLRQTVETMQKKVDNIENILEKVAE